MIQPTKEKHFQNPPPGTMVQWGLEDVGTQIQWLCMGRNLISLEKDQPLEPEYFSGWVEPALVLRGEEWVEK